MSLSKKNPQKDGLALLLPSDTGRRGPCLGPCAVEGRPWVCIPYPTPQTYTSRARIHRARGCLPWESAPPSFTLCFWYPRSSNCLPLLPPACFQRPAQRSSPRPSSLLEGWRAAERTLPGLMCGQGTVVVGRVVDRTELSTRLCVSPWRGGTEPGMWREGEVAHRLWVMDRGQAHLPVPPCLVWVLHSHLTLRWFWKYFCQGRTYLIQQFVSLI